MKPLNIFAAIACAAISFSSHAQEKSSDKSSPPAEHRAATPFDPHLPDCRKQASRVQAYDCEYARGQQYTYQLQNVTQPNDANEILVAIRNLFDPSLKVFLVSDRSAITFFTYPEEYARIEAFIKTLDRPRRTFRITYTITDVDGDKRVGTQHFSMIAADGQRTTLKQGSKVPVATGAYSDGKTAPAGQQTQFTYLDVGINIDCTPNGYSGGARLRAKVEQSSVAPEPAVIAGVAEPIIRQSVLEGTTDIPSGKPVMLGSVDVPGTTHRLDVVVAVDAMQ